MSSKPFLKRNWKTSLNVITFAALVLTVYLLREQIIDTLKNLRHVNGWVLALILPLEAIGYHGQARMYQQMFQTAGTKLSYRSMLKTSLELNFVNQVFPSGGVSGISYFGLRLRSLGVSGSQATLIQSIKLLLVFVSFVLILFVGVFLLAIHGNAGQLVIFVATVIAMSVLGGTGLFVYIIGSRQRVDKFFTWLTRMVNRITRFFTPKSIEVINVEGARKAFQDFHETYARLRGRLSRLKWPFFWALMLNATEVLVIYVVYISFGHWVDIGAIILAYGVANFAGLISVLPGGVGIFEALMITVLATAGVSPAVSLPVTVAYRVLNTFIQAVPGYYYYHKAISEGSVKKAEIELAHDR